MSVESTKFKSWKNFKTNKTVGIITTIFSEQFLNKTYDTITLNPENFSEEINLYDIDSVFFDNEIFEEDHPWYKKNRGHIINYLKSKGINICIIKNTNKEINKVFKQPFVLEINPYIENYSMEKDLLKTPLLIDTNIYNPINSHKTIDVLYFSVGKLKVSPELKLYNKTFRLNKEVIQENNISRSSLEKLFNTLKKSKVLYICKSDKIDEVTLRYIEAIAYLNTTNVIFDYTFDIPSKYSCNTQIDKSNISRLRILLNNETYSLKQALMNQREILSNYTFILKQDLSNFLQANMKNRNKPKVSVITSTNRNQNLNFYLNQMSNQKMVEIELNIVTHGFEVSKDKQLAYKNKVEFPIKFISADLSKSLGACLNLAIEESQYDVIAKIDDDDFYLEYYLFDQWLAMQYSGASVVGKTDGYYYFEEDDLIARRNIGRYFKYDHFIMGATIMAKGSLMRKMKFSDLPRAVDTDFLKRVNEKEEKIFIGHPFEMCVFRAADVKGHTWKINTLAMLKSSEIVSFGSPLAYVRLKKKNDI